MDLPITTDKRDLLTQLKRTSVSWEVRLDDSRQRRTYFVVAVDLSRVHVSENRSEVTQIISLVNITWCIN